jgi:hypothetical protein
MTVTNATCAAQTALQVYGPYPWYSPWASLGLRRGGTGRFVPPGTSGEEHRCEEKKGTDRAFFLIFEENLRGEA